MENEKIIVSLNTLEVWTKLGYDYMYLTDKKTGKTYRLVEEVA